jgi:hypothetical protein
MERLDEARIEWNIIQAQLDEYEETIKSIDPNILLEFISIYQRRGGDQYRPDPMHFVCKIGFIVL